jgi:hypothetical protein
MGYFLVKANKNVHDLKVGDRIEESDFATLVDDGTFLQLEYKEELDKPRQHIVKPGLWSIEKDGLGLKLKTTSFVSDSILENFVNVKDLIDKIDCFFRNLNLYKEFGIEIPRRAALYYGPAGVGKTTGISQVAKKYLLDNETAIIIWATDKFDPYEVKDFVKTFKYDGVKKLIVVAEDIGGVEMDQIRIKSTSSLLSLLDNKEKTFTIPVFIIATTNFPEVFVGNLTNRPGRFDDKIEAKYPNGEERFQLIKFFAKNKYAEDLLERIKEKKYDEFSAAHLQEAIIRSAIYEMPLVDSLNSIAKDIENYKKSFRKTRKVGIGITDDDE